LAPRSPLSRVFLFAYISAASAGLPSVQEGEIDLPAIWLLALLFSAATPLFGVVTYLLPKLMRRMLGPDLGSV
jgi:hypothetical protein